MFTTTPLTKDHVSSIFNLLTSPDTASSFFDHVADDVSWTVTGSAHPQACHFTSKAEVLADMGRIAGLFTVPHKLRIVNVLVAQGENTAVVEVEGSDGKLKNGTLLLTYRKRRIRRARGPSLGCLAWALRLILSRYLNADVYAIIGKDYKNQYLYIVGFNSQGQISSTKGYMDTAMVRDAFEGSGLE